MADSTQGEALLRERVRSLAEAVLARHEAELVDLQVSRGRSNLVRLVVDRNEGIDLDTCATISDQLSRMLDADDPIPGRYTLEVTSPGADRPLKTQRDFDRNIGRPLHVQTDVTEFEGTLDQVEPDRIRLSTKDGEQWIDVAAIKTAKVVLPW